MLEKILVSIHFAEECSSLILEMKIKVETERMELKAVITNKY